MFTIFKEEKVITTGILVFLCQQSAHCEVITNTLSLNNNLI